MPIEQAIWFPFWYELDQSIAVGKIAELDFFKEVPDYIVNDGMRVFYHGDWQEKCRPLFERVRVKILSIRHPTLGSIKAIDTNGLDYTFSMSDGQIQKVEAEETPGLVYGRTEPIDDWRVYVDLEVDPAAEQ